MDQSYTDSDISLSPTKIFDRLQVLRQLQLLQRGKLQKQCLQYQDSPETSSSITEIVSQFSNTTSYNTFRSLLQSCDSSNDATPRQGVFLSPNLSQKLKEKDLIEGVKALNLSQESEFIINSPLSSKSRASAPSRNEGDVSPAGRNAEPKQKQNEQISLDEMPILSPKQDFETMLLEKLKNEKVPKQTSPKIQTELMILTKKPFLKRGEGMTRFGLKKADLVMQNVQSLPWHRKSLQTRVTHTPIKVTENRKQEVHIMVSETKKSPPACKDNTTLKRGQTKESMVCNYNNQDQKNRESVENSKSDKSSETNDCEIHTKLPEPKIQLPKEKHPLRMNKGKTWAAVLTKEQSDFLRQLKQSDYYKNFVSPAKSTISDASCDEIMHQQRQEREVAEQNMFELLENKVANENFNLENSFINKFLKRNLECSGDSTPMVMQKCLANNPNLLHIFPDIHKKRNVSECSCEYTDCSDACSVSSCSSCKTVEESNYTQTSPNKNFQKDDKQKGQFNKPKRIEVEKKAKGAKDTCQTDKVAESDAIKANMEEMNAKLVATSELLKDRLQELEDEIETFRKENSHLAKLREEIDAERQKFYEEKNAFEQKFNEEKILSEYYLAEEKDKLNKQKQMYERYVREIRGRLNKKEKDEVISLKKEINDLKEEIRIKDAKSTSTIARLRNQLKIMEKEKNNLQEEIEKLKKENRRIQHSNEITRRLTNVKYLEEINKKLTHMSKTTHSEIDIEDDVKYKAYEIERQSRSRRVQPAAKTSRQRAKSVPNLNVTSRYAKYFSQRDAVSHVEKNDLLCNEQVERYYQSDDDSEDNKHPDDLESLEDNENEEQLPNEAENQLEKMYLERFQNVFPATNRLSQSMNADQLKSNENIDTFFMRKPNSNSRGSKSPRENLSPHLNSGSNTHRSKSPISILSNRSSGRKSPMIKDPIVMNHSGDSFSSPKSPISTFGNHSYGTQRPATVINQDKYRDKLMVVSPEPSTSKTSNVAKTTLNPTEIKKSDGSRELRFPNGNVKYISADGKYSKFMYYNGDIKENFYKEGRIKYYYAEAKTYHTTHADGLEVLEFPDGQVEKRYKDGSSEIRLPNGSTRYHDPKNEHVREEWRFPDGTALTVSANGEQRIVFSNGQVEVHAKDHKRREFPDGTVKLVYTDGTSETRYASGRVRVKDKHGNLIMDSSHEQH